MKQRMGIKSVTNAVYLGSLLVTVQIFFFQKCVFSQVKTDTISVCVFVVYGAHIALIGYAMDGIFFFLGTYCSDKLSTMDYSF